jgi:deoxycytidylate deaminase
MPVAKTIDIEIARKWKAAGHLVTPDPDGAPAAPGPCAKVRVFCTLVHPDGRRWTGENSVRRAQDTCPRGGMPSGDGYHLCRDVCDQIGHAEVVALAAAGADAAGCTAYVEGRDFVCYDCQARLVAAGVRRFVLGAPPTHSLTTARDLAEIAQFLDDAGESVNAGVVRDLAEAWDYEAYRLRRVVRALDLDRTVPPENNALRGCLFSVLGIIAYNLDDITLNARRYVKMRNALSRRDLPYLMLEGESTSDIDEWCDK